MGFLALNRLMPMKRKDRRRRRIQGRDGSLSLRKIRRSPRQVGNFHGGQRVKDSVPYLPEDIWGHIHSLMPMQDAARAACVSRAFLRSWRCFPDLTFSKEIVGSGNEEEFPSKVDQILRNHSGPGLKKFNLAFRVRNSNDCHLLNSWLQIAVTPGIESLSLAVHSDKATYTSPAKFAYTFPCSLLYDRIGDSIRYLQLGGGAFRPTVRFSCLKNLTTLHLYAVGINENELACLLSSCFALEQMDLRSCHEIACLNIPHMLQRLRYLQVVACRTLRVIENNAPNISNLHFFGTQLQLKLVESMQLKSVQISHSGAFYYARATLPAIMPNLETLTLNSSLEKVKTPVMHSKFLHLKNLTLDLGGFSFSSAYCSFFSFLDASPSLETFTMRAPMKHMENGSIFGDPSHLRRVPVLHHNKLKSVKITGFSSAKTLVEITINILENTTSLESLTLDTTYCPLRCSDSKIGSCFPISEEFLLEIPKARSAIRAYIEGRVPSTVTLDVLGPCSRCHAFDL